MKNSFFILLILIVGCNDNSISGFTSCKIQEPDQRILIKFEHFKSDFDVYWHDEEKMASLALSKSKFSEEQKQNLFNSLDMDLYSEDIVSVTLYSNKIDDSISLDPTCLKGLLIYHNENGKLSIRLYSNEFNELKKLIETPVSFLSTNDIANAGDVISTIHDSKAIHSLVFIDYAQIPREILSRPILSEILDTMNVERVID
jgi:hypothetical protein